MLPTPPLGTLGSLCWDERALIISAVAAVLSHHSGGDGRDMLAVVPQVTIIQVLHTPGASCMCCQIYGTAITLTALAHIYL